MKIQSTFTSPPVLLAMDEVVAITKVRKLIAKTVKLLVLLTAASARQSALDEQVKRQREVPDNGGSG